MSQNRVQSSAFHREEYGIKLRCLNLKTMAASDVEELESGCLVELRSSASSTSGDNPTLGCGAAGK